MQIIAWKCGTTGKIFEDYKEDWIEQELCLDLISLYRQNFRWNINYEQ
jgi:hypothetical protein